MGHFAQLAETFPRRIFQFTQAVFESLVNQLTQRHFTKHFQIAFDEVIDVLGIQV